MKSLFGGGAVFVTALLTASVLFYARPLAAEPAFQDPTRQQQKKETTKTVTTINGMTETRDRSAAQATDAKTAINVSEDFDEAPPLMAPATTKAGDKDATKLIVAAAPQTYLATAYNLSGRTASGKPVSKGIIAADPGFLPLGTRVRLEAGLYSGEYLVADTGGSVRGRKIDVWVPTTREACRFGRRSVSLTVLTYGGRRFKGKR
ncbi:MAG TPA: 3D domain-containing protein [Pyrinomonadaceae bacterium]|jgi:3D (Asp-Asp-Asp) domain-containing protein|nr:3D domain-containing protein [Pyrinomonadaceae bacterium]